MTNIEQKALALVNEIEREWGEDELTLRIMRGLIMDEALCRSIERHEAFRQEVSDAVEDYTDHLGVGELHFASKKLGQFIIPAPKLDPLEDALDDMGLSPHYAEEIRAALDALGFEIREKNDG